MSLGVLDKLGQSVTPKIFKSLTRTGLVETMDIEGRNVTAGTGGGRIKGSTTRDYREIPVSVEPYRARGFKTIAGDKPLSVQEYLLTFATHIDGERIEIDSKKDRLKVLARGNEPDKYYRIVSIKDTSGVIFEAVCEREN